MKFSYMDLFLIQRFANALSTQSFALEIQIDDSRGQRIGQNISLGTVDTNNPIGAQTVSSSGNLKAGERYTASLRATWSSTLEATIVRSCFEMPPDMNTPFSGPGSIGGTSGCFAIGGVSLGGGKAAIQACLCGARHTTTGKWARTDVGDGYKYIMDAAERTRQGCTTN